MVYRYFLPVDELHFHFVDGFLCCTEPFSLMQIHLFIFAFVSDVKSRRWLPRLTSRSLATGFLFLSFMVSRFTFKSFNPLSFPHCIILFLIN